MPKGKPTPSVPAKSPPIADQLAIEAAVRGMGQTLVVNQQQELVQHQGPLPSPEVLKLYEAIKPGLIDKIIQMAEQEANHRRRLEVDLVQAQFFEARRYRLAELMGMIFAFLIGVFGLSCATYCAVHGAQIAGSVIGAGGIGGLVTAFITGRTLFLRQRKQDAEMAIEQAKQLQEISLKQNSQ